MCTFVLAAFIPKMNSCSHAIELCMDYFRQAFRILFCIKGKKQTLLCSMITNKTRLQVMGGRYLGNLSKVILSTICCHPVVKNTTAHPITLYCAYK